MHEVSLAEAALGLIEDAARAQGFAAVHVVHIELGALSCVDPDALAFAFEAVASGTCAQGAVLEFDTVPGRGVCGACGADAPMVTDVALCPRCGRAPLRVLDGTHMRVIDLLVA